MKHTFIERIVSDLLSKMDDMGGNVFVFFPPKDEMDADEVIKALLVKLNNGRNAPAADVDCTLQLRFPLQEEGSVEQVRFFDAPYAASRFKNSVDTFAINLTALSENNGAAEIARLSHYLDSLPTMQFVLYMSAPEDEAARVSAKLEAAVSFSFNRIAIAPPTRKELAALIGEYMSCKSILFDPYAQSIAAFVETAESMNYRIATRLADELVRMATHNHSGLEPGAIVEKAMGCLSLVPAKSHGKIGFV